MNTGVQRIVRELFRSLSAAAPVTPLVWDPGLVSYCTLSTRERGFLERPFAGRNHPGDAEPGRRANPVPLWSKLARRFVHGRNRLDLPARLTAADTLFVPEIFQDNRTAWLEALPARTAARRVGVCHDALAWRHPDVIPPARQAGFAEYLNVLGGFDRVVTISQESAADLRACWREGGRADDQMPPVEIFEWPVNHAGTPRPALPPAFPSAGQPSVLCVGTFEPRKNHLLLLAAAERAWAGGGRFELVLIGRTTAHWGARVSAEVQRLHAAGRPVRWLRHVDDGTLRQAYKSCAFSVFPSLVEGLGLPILESLWYGKPCVCGNNGALGEVSASGGCLPTDQRNPAALAASLTRLLTDAELYRRLCAEAAAREFNTWEDLAARLLPLLRPA